VNLETLLQSHSYKEAILQTQARLAQNPDDVFARFVFGYALYHLEGATQEVLSILKEAQESALNIAKQAGILIGVTVSPAKPSPFATSAASLAQTDAAAAADAAADAVFPFGVLEKESGVPGGLLAVFYTTSMAELLLKQGYREMARDILRTILQRDNTNENARQILQALASEEPPAMVSDTAMTSDATMASSAAATSDVNNRLSVQTTALNNFLTALEKRHLSR
jgi:hypothetical protein